MLRYDIIQGTTYAPLAFLRFSRPIISHFGSTTFGFLRAAPKINLLENGFLVNSLEEAKEKIGLLLNNADFRRRLCLKAAETAEQFKSETLINKTLALYKKILKETN